MATKKTYVPKTKPYASKTKATGADKAKEAGHAAAQNARKPASKSASKPSTSVPPKSDAVKAKLRERTAKRDSVNTAQAYDNAYRGDYEKAYPSRPWSGKPYHLQPGESVKPGGKTVLGREGTTQLKKDKAAAGHAAAEKTRKTSLNKYKKGGKISTRKKK